MKHEGKGKTLNEAFEKAWDKLKKDVGDPDPQRWYAAAIEVQGTNPINQFRVRLES